MQASLIAYFFSAVLICGIKENSRIESNLPHRPYLIIGISVFFFLKRKRRKCILSELTPRSKHHFYYPITPLFIVIVFLYHTHSLSL